MDIPTELDVPWGFLQRHFDCVSQSGNNTSMLVLNFEPTGKHVYKINTGLPERIRASEEAFSQIFFDVEVLVRRISASVVNAQLSTHPVSWVAV